VRQFFASPEWRSCHVGAQGQVRSGGSPTDLDASAFKAMPANSQGGSCRELPVIIASRPRWFDMQTPEVGEL